MTLNGVIALILLYFTQFDSFTDLLGLRCIVVIDIDGQLQASKQGLRQSG